MHLYVCDYQSQNKLIRITILLHKSTSRGKETRVVDALRLKHIFSIFLSVTAYYKVVSTIGKTNTIAIRYLQDRSIQGIRHVMVNSMQPTTIENGGKHDHAKKYKTVSDSSTGCYTTQET